MKIFLLVGQSNMAGRGRLEDVEAIVEPRVHMFRDGQWQTAREPLHTDKPHIAGVGLGMSFAQSVLASLPPEEEIGLLPCAVGGTPLARWQPGADLYEAALAVAGAGLADARHELAGILWHQGEGDSGDADLAESYAERLLKTMNAFRADLSEPSCPVIVGTLGDFMAQRADADFAETVNQNIRRMPQLLQHCQVVSAAGLGDNGDVLHFNASALRTLGQRYAAAYATLSA